MALGESPFPSQGLGEGETALLIGGDGGIGGGDPCVGLTTYTSVRLGYARNGRTVTFVHDESWCWDGWSPWPVDGSYQIAWAQEFRYDGARARYMNRSLDPVQLMSNSLVDFGTVWTDYDGDETYGDFTVSSTGVATNTDKYEPGLWRSVGVSNYLHNDHLGTLRNTTDASGSPGVGRVFTAFGERLAGANDRFGYVGAWGYQARSPFPYLHVGARYYDPSSGRFLQRDPIGIAGAINVYTYVEDLPTTAVDPAGLWRSDLIGDRHKFKKPPEPDNRPVLPALILEVLPKWLDDPAKVAEVQKWLRRIGWAATPPAIKAARWLRWTLWGTAGCGLFM